MIESEIMESDLLYLPPAYGIRARSDTATSGGKQVLFVGLTTRLPCLFVFDDDSGTSLSAQPTLTASQPETTQYIVMDLKLKIDNVLLYAWGRQEHCQMLSLQKAHMEVYGGAENVVLRITDPETNKCLSVDLCRLESLCAYTQVGRFSVLYRRASRAGLLLAFSGIAGLQEYQECVTPYLSRTPPPPAAQLSIVSARGDVDSYEEVADELDCAFLPRTELLRTRV
ncbi:hypothetical protein NUW54_g13807 [Trametes sanguinea]|uniref:Uncharacterized protein n=1 Tax=Trametes sanguinea TaxID=158606 RepID=A0ACC1MJM4_9APHY|nr:hypothetical protein NUW54_g13807 [Trametes sanguinea]